MEAQPPETLDGTVEGQGVEAALQGLRLDAGDGCGGASGGDVSAVSRSGGAAGPVAASASAGPPSPAAGPQQQVAEPSQHPFETEPGDHAETPLEAYQVRARLR